MKTKIVVISAFLAALAVVVPGAYAEDESTCEAGRSGVSISPVSQPFSITSGTVLDSEFTIKNMSVESSTFSVTTAPYSMTNEEYTSPNFSDSEENYTKYTQIARWIKFEDDSGNYNDTLNIEVGGCTEKSIKYHVVVPDSIPNGGQYAVILVKSTGSGNSGSIKAVPQVGLLISARTTGGETVRGAEVSDVKVAKTYPKIEGEKTVNVNKINAHGTVKNTGNVDLEIKTKLTVKNIFGGVIYEDEASVSILPETTRKVSDVWDETPAFGLFWASYSVTSNGQNSDNVRLFLVMPFWAIVLIIVLVTFAVIWIVMMIKKRQARKVKFRD